MAASNRGGKREGAGNKSNAARHAPKIATFTNRCAGHLAKTYENLEMLADGRAVRVETEWARAGTVTRKDIARDKDGQALRDKNGKLTVIDVLVYPGLPADRWVRQKRKVIELPPDLPANVQIVDRVMGKPTERKELSGPEGAPLKAYVGFDPEDV